MFGNGEKWVAEPSTEMLQLKILALEAKIKRQEEQQKNFIEDLLYLAKRIKCLEDDQKLLL